MSVITYHHENGHADLIEAVVGTSVMRAAVINGVEGIIGECGGQAMCATCHVYVREEFLHLLPEMSDDEEEMLEITASPRNEVRSRLGCQLKITTSLSEIAVDVPPTQVQ